ncbi:hypothetical protein QBC36DRAFT_219783 [Triangularia setosa]|uniref:Uncharacterized protein n=1 Tax=Triangularia setosa TaxID=2587417 RepID=A0AAN6W3Z3_9PEZI|nr:hypothetical protein QBC36DRAFT_219783 [Podospora setosa]
MENSCSHSKPHSEDAPRLGSLPISRAAQLCNTISSDTPSLHSVSQHPIAQCNMGQQQYQNVLGLFLAWEEDGGEHASTEENPFHTQLEELAHTLQMGYNYSVDQWFIPSEKYPRALDKKLNEVVERSNNRSQEGQNTLDLLIVYYGGHAVINPNERENDLLLVPYPKSRSASISWATDVLSRLQYLEGTDILILLDCCYAQRAQHAIDHMHRPPPGRMVTLAAVDIDGKAIEDGDYTFTRNLCQQLEELANNTETFSISQLHGDLRRGAGSWRRRQPDGKIPDPIMSSNATQFGLLGPVAQSTNPAATSIVERPPFPQPVGHAKEEQRPGVHIAEGSLSTQLEPPSPQASNKESHLTAHGTEVSPFVSATSLQSDSWNDNVSYYVGSHDVDVAWPLNSPPGTPSTAHDSSSPLPVGSAISLNEYLPIKRPNARPRTRSTEELPYLPAESPQKHHHWNENLNICVGPPDGEAVMPTAPMTSSPAASATSLQGFIPSIRNTKAYPRSRAAGLSPPVPYTSRKAPRGSKTRTDTAPYPRTSQTFASMSPNQRSQTFDNAEFGRAGDSFGGSFWKAGADFDSEETSWNCSDSRPRHWLYDDDDRR